MEIKKLEDFIKCIPESLSGNIPVARHLYLELGKRSFYDPEYKYNIFGEEELEYINKPYSNPNIIICTTLVKQYNRLLNMANIPNNISADVSGHYFNVFEDEEGQEHETDITQDLKNIQFGCKTNYFGINSISQEDLRELDKVLGYIPEGRGYSDEYWYIIRDAISNERLTAQQRLELIFNNLHRLGDPQKPRNYRTI